MPRRWMFLAATGAVPALVVVIALARPHWYPAGDMAQAELHLRGFWHHPPLVGAAGRIVGDDGTQGSHPGPAAWVALYPVYALSGRTSFGLLLSVAVVQAGTLGAAIWLAVRRAGLPFAIALTAGLLFAMRASGPAFVSEPWNPWLAFPPFVVFVLAAWSVLDGDRRLLWVAVVAGSFVVQAHIGYALVVGGLLLLAVIAAVVDTARLPPGERPAPSTWWRAGAAAVVMWIPPVIDELRRHPGNLTLLRQHFLNPRSPSLTWSQTGHVVALQFNALGPWLTGASDSRTSVVGALLFVAVWAGAIAVAVRRHDHRLLRLHALLGAGVLLGIVSIKRIFDGYFEYTTRWAWALVVFVLAASAWTFWRAAGRTSLVARVGSRQALVAAGVALAALTLLTSIQFGRRAELPGSQDSRLLAALAPVVEDRLDSAPHYLLRWHDPTALDATGFGLLLELERHGYDVGVDRQWAAAVLPSRTIDEADVDAVLYLVVGRRIDEVRRQTGVDEVAYVDPRTPAQRTRTDELLATLAPYLTDPEIPALGAPPLPPEAQTALIELDTIRQPAAVFLAAPGTVIAALTS